LNRLAIKVAGCEITAHTEVARIVADLSVGPLGALIVGAWLGGGKGFF